MSGAPLAAQELARARRRALLRTAACAMSMAMARSLAARVGELSPASELPPGGLGPAPAPPDATALHSLQGPGGGGGFWQVPRTVWLRRPDSGQEIRATYWARGRLVQPEYERLCYFMRDLRMQYRIDAALRSGRALPAGWYSVIGMSPAMLDVLYAVGAWLDVHDMGRALIVTSAFRHPLTNAAIEGAARNSLHQRGGACDIVVPDVSSVQVGKFGVWLRGGGVGFYPGKRFTHVDDGRLRAWRG